MRFFYLCAIIPFLFSQTMGAFAETVSQQSKTQYVLISFDGAHDNKLWARSRDFAKQNNIQFTYFLSCVFLLQRSDRSQYQPPKLKRGSSNVGFAMNKQEVETRLGHIWQAHMEGHEIASHGCGHFDGKAWSTKDWEQEIHEFERITANAYKNNGISGEPSKWQNFVATQITGFRAPYLSDGKPVQDALKNNGFVYQASGVTNAPERPKFEHPDSKKGLATFGLPLIPEGPSKRPVIAMDYNLYVRHSKGEEKPEQSAVFEERSYQAFKTAFDKEYKGKREPFQMGFHFVLMNDGAYWRAMERLAREICSKPDVKCTSYQNYLAETGTVAR
ncbi:polysaccharide deacetylase [Brucellaceae bacterium C25G]